MDFAAQPGPARFSFADYKPTERFEAALNDAESLLKFAAQEGVTIPPDVVRPIVEARMKYGNSGFNESELIAFYSSMTILSSLLKPVTAESFRACEAPETKARLRKDRGIAVSVTVFTLICSAIAFVNHGFSEQIVQDVKQANQLAVALRTNLSENSISNIENPCEARNQPNSRQGPVDTAELTNLQQFASLSRDIYKESLRYNVFVSNWEDDPFARNPQSRADLEINPAVVNFPNEVVCKIRLYERVRDFSRNVTLDNGYVYGAVGQYLLPVLYALVGAYAFRLRSFSETVRNYTYHPSYADSARMIGAFIVGSVMSIFNGITQNVSLPPLAVAFLAGYAVEVFFSLLDAIVRTIGKNDAPAATKSNVTIIHSDNSVSGRTSPAT